MLTNFVENFIIDALNETGKSLKSNSLKNVYSLFMPNCNGKETMYMRIEIVTKYLL